MRIYVFPLLLAFVAVMPVLAEPETKQEGAAAKIEALWNDLADMDAARAYRAIWVLTRTPKGTAAFITGHLEPAVEPDPGKVERLLDDLNSDTFAVRARAQQALVKWGGLAESALKKRLTANLSLETRQRVEKLLSRLGGPLALPDHLRAVRAVETLEHIGSDAARAVLAKYAAGAPGAHLTQEAKAALGRLRQPAPAAFAPALSRTDLYGDALPLGAVGRLGTIRFRRNEPHFRDSGLGFLPGGQALVTLSHEHEVQIWDFPGGRLRQEISTRPLYIRGFALSPDGKRVAVAGFYRPVGNMAVTEVRLLDLPSGKIVKTFPRPVGDYFQLAFSPDNNLLFSLSSREGVLHIEEIASGKELAQKRFPSDVMNAMAVSPDGAWLALASGPNTRKVFLWKWRSEEPRQIVLPADRIGGLGFSPDGKLLVALADFGSLCAWDVARGRLLFQQDPGDDDYFFLGKPAFSLDGKTLAVLVRARQSSFRGKIQLFDPLTGRCLQTLDTGAVGGALAFTPDSRTLAMTCDSGLRLWDVASRQEITAIKDAHDSYVSNIVVSPKGFLITAGDDGSVRLWDAATTKQRWQATAEHWIRALALSPDGRLAAASSLDDAVYLWDARSGRQIYRLAGHGRMGGRRALGFSADGRSLASWGDDHYLRLWDMKTGKARLEHRIRPKGVEIPDDDDPQNDLKRFAFDFAATALTPDVRTFVVDVGGHFHLFDTRSGKETLMFPSEGRRGDGLAISADGKRLLASSYGDFRVGNHAVSLIDLSSGAKLQRLVLPGSAAGRVAFSPDGRTFATSVDGPPGEIILHETASGKVRATIRGFRGRVQALAFFPDLRRLASGQSDSTVLIWDLSAPEHTR